jgi:DGQHR domain-containing protein
VGNGINGRGIMELKLKNRCIKTEFGKITVHTFPMKVKDVVAIYYVAVRGRDEEEGAVQRVLNPKRIQSIADFVLSGNMFVNTFVLNWTNKQKKPIFKNNDLTIPIIKRSAQVIDGQHRLSGLEIAIKQKPQIGQKEILVSLCIDLSTQESATIFLNINTEQKPVPKSLVYDLYGIVVQDKNVAINRATDIAHELHENPDSPYFEKIKFPGVKKPRGIIDLSTVVSSLKNCLEQDGPFNRYHLASLMSQKNVIFNYFTALKDFYDRDNLWDNRNINPFMKSTGFYAAIENLVEMLLPKCTEKKSFTVETIKNIMALNNGPLLKWESITQLDGKTARAKVKEFLNTNLSQSLPDEKEYEF